MNRQTRNCRNTFRKGPEIIMGNQVKLKLHVFLFCYTHQVTIYILFLFLLQLSQDNSVFESSGLTLNSTLAI